MDRRTTSLPDDLDEDASINVFSLTGRAIEVELDRRARMASLGAWLDELDEEHGPPSAEEIAAAEAWWASRRPVVVDHDGATVISVLHASNLETSADSALPPG